MSFQVLFCANCLRAFMYFVSECFYVLLCAFRSFQELLGAKRTAQKTKIRNSKFFLKFQKVRFRLWFAKNFQTCLNNIPSIIFQSRPKKFWRCEKRKTPTHPYNTLEKNTQKIVKIMKKLKSMDKIVNAMIIQFWNEKRS